VDAKESPQWVEWNDRLGELSFEWVVAKSTDLVVETIDTLRHEALLKGYIETNTPFLLCGPPGSGKTMTLLSTLRKLGN